MRLLDLVEEDHRVGLAAHLLGELPALFVADIARRRADEPRHRVLLHVLRHVDADQVILGVEQERRQRLAEFRLADARRAEEEEAAVGPVGIGKARARAPDRVRHHAHRLVLADDALVQLLFHVDELVALALHHLRDRDAGRARHDLGDLLGADLGAQQLRLSAARRRLLRLVQLRLELRDLAVLELRHAVPVALAFRFLHLQAQLLDLFLDLLAALHLRLLRLPLFFQVCVFALKALDLGLDQLEALARGFVGLLLHRLALDA